MDNPTQVDEADAGTGACQTYVYGNEIQNMSFGPGASVYYVNQTQPPMAQSDSGSGLQASEEPPVKKARSSLVPQKELEEILNKRIIDENKALLRFRGDLLTPREEKWPELRKWDRHCQSLQRTASAQDLNDMQKTTSRLTDRKVDMNQLFSCGARFLTVLGGPGSGKSTFVRRFGKMVLDGEIKDMEEISLVYFVDARELAKDETISFLRFFFSKLIHGFDKISREAQLWLQEENNQSKMLIIIDGLNDMQDLAMDESHEAVGYEEPANPAAILYNLLRGRLLPGAKILAASPSYVIQTYHNSVQPKTTIKLSGFTDDNAKYIFQEMVGLDIGRRWEAFSDTLKSLCSTPLYLVYVAFMYRSDHDMKLQVDDVTSIFIRLIQNFWNKNGWERDPATYNKLKKFCLEMLMQGRFVFESTDIVKYGLEREHIKNLCISDPQAKVGVMETNRNENVMYFGHISIQETLACLGFLDLPFDEFESVLSNYMQSVSFATVKQLICGILLNKRMQLDSFFADVPSKKEKTALLLKTLRLSPSDRLSPDEMLAHLTCLNEMIQPIEEQRILPDAVDLSKQDLSECTTHIIAPVISNCKYLSQLILYLCDLNDSKIDILWGCLETSDLRIQLLNLGFNPKIGPSGMKTVAKTTCHCQVHELDLHRCELTSSHMKEFFTEFEKNESKKQLERLLLRNNPNLGEDGLDAVAAVVEIGKLKRLDVSSCAVSAANLKKMMCHNLSSLEALLLTANFHKSGSPEDELRMFVVGECIASNAIEEVHINWLGLELHDLHELEKSFQGRPVALKKLNISNNHNLISEECHEVLCRIVKVHGTSIMDIHKCGFSDHQQQELKRWVKEFSRLDTYLPLELDSEEFHNTLKRNKGIYLDVSLTNTKEKFETLPQILDQFGTKFRKLCLPEEKLATSTDIEILLRLLPYISEELWLGEWKIGQAEEETLRKKVSNNCKFPNIKICLSADNVIQGPKL